MEQSINQVAADIYQLCLPLPFPLRIVNCYLLKDRQGWTVVDAGLNYPPGRETWERDLAELGIAWRDISRIVLTHAHPDHYGMAGWLAERSGAPVYLTAIERDFAQQVWQNGAQNDYRMGELFRAHGMPASLTDSISQDMAALRPLTGPHPPLHLLPANGTLQIGTRTFEILLTPGHSEGHAVLYCRAEHLLLCGDAVLIKITPNVGRWPTSSANPLAAFLQSLSRLQTLDVALALPGHGPLITRFTARVAELQAHHAERLHLAQAAADAGATGWEICTSIFVVDQLSSHQLRFAMAETLAHLDYLVDVERLERVEGVPVRYRKQ